MKTTLPISTISYNTEPYLKLKLEELTKAHVISFWAYIWHKPEEDERKPHFHVYVEPARSVFTDTFIEEFIEPCDDEKPLRCLPCHKAKFDDWYMYGLHDETYLSRKGQSRQYHYKHKDFISSDEDYFLELVKNIDLLKQTPFETIRDAVGNGLTFDEFVSQGSVPIQQFYNFEKAFKSVQKGLFRNGHDNHEDPDQEEGD